MESNYTIGRQNSGYFIKQLWHIGMPWLMFDAYLIRYPTGSYVPTHIDAVPNKKHWRINLVYKDCVKGGELEATHALINTRRFKLFRSDKEHSIARVEEGERKVLSFGFAF